MSSSAIVEGDGTYNEVFRGISLASLPAPASSVTIINSETSVADALKILGEKKIHSAPVRDNLQPDDAHWLSKYLGVIDFNTIVNWMMSKTWGRTPSDVNELRSLHTAFETTKVGQLLEQGSHSPFVPVDVDDNSFLDAMLLLGKHGIHRAWVVKDNDIVNVVSQSGVIEILGQNLKEFSGITSKTIGDLGVTTKSTYCVSLADTYWDAFRQMHDGRLSAVPIVSNDDIVGVISVRDVRHMILEPAKFKMLPLPIGQFLTKGLDVFTCKLTDTLEQVVRKFQASRVHRLFLVDASNKLQGVVSLREVLALFVREPSTDDGSSYISAFTQKK